MNDEFLKWSNQLCAIHLPRWEELPDMDLYKDQVITLIEKIVGDFMNPDEKILTPWMINNYVKWKMIPPPNRKKQYNRSHLAYLIAITILKQVMEIKDVKSGILYQAKVYGTKGAYNAFCQEQEKAVRLVVGRYQVCDDRDIINEVMDDENLALKMAAISFASKLIATKKIALQEMQMRESANQSSVKK